MNENKTAWHHLALTALKIRYALQQCLAWECGGRNGRGAASSAHALPRVLDKIFGIIFLVLLCG
jgi:hypothetical protein